MNTKDGISVERSPARVLAVLLGAVAAGLIAWYATMGISGASRTWYAVAWGLAFGSYAIGIARGHIHRHSTKWQAWRAEYGDMVFVLGVVMIALALFLGVGELIWG